MRSILLMHSWTIWRKRTLRNNKIYQLLKSMKNHITMNKKMRVSRCSMKKLRIMNWSIDSMKMRSFRMNKMTCLNTRKRKRSLSSSNLLTFQLWNCKILRRIFTRNILKYQPFQSRKSRRSCILGLTQERNGNQSIWNIDSQAYRQFCSPLVRG